MSEVLVTLAIVGVIAALIIAPLINSYKNQQAVVRLNKIYSVLSQAIIYLENDSGTDIKGLFSINNVTNHPSFLNLFAQRINVVKNCGNASGCWSNSLIKLINGTNSAWNVDTWNNSANGILSDGTFISAHFISSTCTFDFIPSDADPSNPYHKGCGSIWVNVNGFNGPNQLGRDVFEFLVTQTGVYPRGIYSNDYGSADCTTNGEGCASKVILADAINY